jgi:hypothetical protein
MVGMQIQTRSERSEEPRLARYTSRQRSSITSSGRFFPPVLMPEPASVPVPLLTPPLKALAFLVWTRVGQAKHNSLITDSVSAPVSLITPSRLSNLIGAAADQAHPNVLYFCSRSSLRSCLPPFKTQPSGYDAGGANHCMLKLETSSGPTPFQNSAFWVQTRAKHIALPTMRHSCLSPRLGLPPFKTQPSGFRCGQSTLHTQA